MLESSPHEVTLLLKAWSAGQEGAGERSRSPVSDCFRVRGGPEATETRLVSGTSSCGSYCCENAWSDCNSPVALGSSGPRFTPQTILVGCTGGDHASISHFF
jgi:hypothetical protein